VNLRKPQPRHQVLVSVPTEITPCRRWRLGRCDTGATFCHWAS